MTFKKCGKIVTGVDLTPAEREALHREVDKQTRLKVAQLLREAEAEAQARFLFCVREQAGWGKRRLTRLFRSYHASLTELVQHYEMDAEDDESWLCKWKLMQCGVNIDSLLDDENKSESAEA